MSANHYQIIKNHVGAMLIELMIAMTIGLLVLSFLLEMYVVSQQSYRLQSALIAISDNAKSAFSILRNDIKAAGHIGCARLTPDFPIITHNGYTITTENSLSATDTELIVRHAELTHVALIGPMQDLMTMQTNKEIYFSRGDILIISDCRHAEIFTVKNVIIFHDSQKIISSFPLRYAYGQDAEISRMAINHYFIAKTTRKNTSALFVKDIKQRTTELVENVSNMHIVFNGASVQIDLDFIASPFKKTWHLYVAARS